MSEFNEYRLLVSDFYDAVGAGRNKAEMDGHANTLFSAGFVKCKDGEYRSASGETATQFLSNALVYGTNAPATQTADKRHANGLTDADIAAIKDPFRRAEVQAEVEGGCRVVPSWQRGPNAPVTVAEISQRTGLSPEMFAKLPPDRKLEIESEIKFARDNGGGNA